MLKTNLKLSKDIKTDDVKIFCKKIDKIIKSLIGHKLITFTVIDNKQNFCDIFRHFANEDEKVYSWWSYRNRDWKKSNRGRRLDHIWVTENLLKHYVEHQIFQIARDFERPSDHVPISATFQLNHVT